MSLTYQEFYYKTFKENNEGFDKLLNKDYYYLDEAYVYIILYYILPIFKTTYILTI